MLFCLLFTKVISPTASKFAKPEVIVVLSTLVKLSIVIKTDNTQ